MMPTPARLRPRRAQSAVETMLLVPLIALVVIALYYLWSIAWASQNAHLRAREYALHGDTYMGSRGNGESGSAPFSGDNYKRADSTSFRFSGRSEDRSLPGVGAVGHDIQVEAVITSD